MGNSTLYLDGSTEKNVFGSLDDGQLIDLLGDVEETVSDGYNYSSFYRDILDELRTRYELN